MSNSSNDLVCLSCGRCCRYYAYVEVSKADLIRWEAQGRRDILSKLTVVHGAKVLPHKRGCPFLVGRLCGIQDTKPLRCRAWPDDNKQRAEVKCEALLKGGCDGRS